ncbi:LysR family transcriptional regulator [Leptothoe sp. PORK10 BA2]|uniref:LysR family transcriptional regulator n=1 Tax=Leptothoe sp. PORK10 BA2 TaxID=3110254 RepID=UPI002B2107C5|nr:LysR family transcriptional regulator [Leptothoe sp. PORK10 BA2]
MNLGKVKLSQLRTLVVISTTQNFSEAALELNLSQSTISHSIAALESELGVVLISRGRHGATLTPAGEAICAKAQQMLQQLDDIGQLASQARGVEGGQVRVGAFRSLASNVLPGAIAKLHTLYPNIQVTITEMDELRDFQQALMEGKIDICATELMPDESFDSLTILHDPCIGLLPPNCPVHTSHLTWEHLYDYPLIASVHSSCTHQLMRALQRAVPPIDLAYRIRTDTTIVGMVNQGLGIGLMHRLSAQPIPKDVRMVQLPFQIFRTLGVSWPKDALLSPAVYAFLDVFKALQVEAYPTAG